eukprot:sb/3468730/
MYVTEAHKTDKHFNLHIVIKTPRISSEELTRVYRTHQTGVITSAGRCNRYELPKYVVLNGMEIYALNKEKCDTLNGINICTQYGIQNMTEMPCLNTMSKCEIVLDKCETNIVETTAGVMIRTNEKVMASKSKDGEEVLEEVEMNKRGVKFISYKSYKLVTVGEVVIRPPTEPVGEFSLTLEDQDIWIMELDKKAEDIHKMNFTNIYQDINKLNHTVNEIWIGKGDELPVIPVQNRRQWVRKDPGARKIYL